MKHRYALPLLIFFVAVLFSGCKNEDDDPVATPIAPIIMNVVFPGQDAIAPGQEVQIAGKGFSKYDQVHIDGDNDAFDVDVIEVTTSSITILVPRDAGGAYAVTITRNGKKTTLDGMLKVPYVVVLDNVVMPGALLQQQDEVLITGTGFEEGDVIRLSADFYPNAKTYEIPVTTVSGGISFTLPEGVFGENTVIIARGDRQTSLGTIAVEAKVGDLVGGGIVYWVDATKTHGLIAGKENAGSAVEQFGPEVAVADAAGTSQSIGSGAANTENIVVKMAALRSAHGWPEWENTKIAAELCAEYSVTEGDLTYSDWFLPSREELIELFKAKGLLAEKGYPVSANNYWSSSEGDGNNAGWSAFYVNFYEAENIVSDIASKSGWTIGVRPVRSF